MNTFGRTLLGALGTALLLLLGACGSAMRAGDGSVPSPQAGPITVRVDVAPPGATEVTVQADKSACNSYSKYDAQLYVQCMQQRGYRLSVLGPDGRPTTIQQLYSRRVPSSATNPPTAVTPSGPATAVNPALSPERQAAPSGASKIPTEASRLARQEEAERAAEREREEAAKAAKEERLVGAQVHAASVADLERQMEFCVGVIGGLVGTNLMSQFKEFGGEVFRQAWPVPSGNEPNGLGASLVALASGTGMRYSRGSQLFEQSHTEGDARRTAYAGGQAVRAAAEKNDVAGLVNVLHKCDKESDELATRMDW